MATKISGIATAALATDLAATTAALEVSIAITTVPLTRKLTLGVLRDFLAGQATGFAAVAVTVLSLAIGATGSGFSSMGALTATTGTYSGLQAVTVASGYAATFMGGNVGIGTTGLGDWASPLQVAGTSDFTGNSQGALVNIFSTATAAIDKGGTLEFGGNTGNGVPVYGFAGIKGAKQTAAGDANYSGYLAFHTTNFGGASSEKMRITDTGNVGIGTTGPTHLLEVNGTFLAAGAGALSSTLAVTGHTGLGQAATATSVLSIAGIPTSAAGLATGDVWSNAGVLTIV